MSDPVLYHVDRFGCTAPGCETQEPNGCIGCGELDVGADGWCSRCNEEFGEKHKERLAPLA